MRRRLGEMLPALVAFALAAWTWLVPAASSSQRHRTVLALLLAAAAWAVGLLLGRLSRLAPLLVAVPVAGWVLSSPSALTSDATAGPLGYANADAALVAQAGAAGALLALAHRGALRAVGLLLSLAAVVVCVFERSAAGSVAALLVLAAGALAAAGRTIRPRAASVAAVLVVVASALVPVAVGAGLAQDSAARAVSERRVSLWSDAVTLARDNPGHGVGTGAFATASKTARYDVDTQATHSAALEVTAEEGLAGGLLALLALLSVPVAFAGLGRRGAPGIVLVGLAAWTGLCLQAAVDYVLDFPAVLATGAAVAGMSYGMSRTRKTDAGGGLRGG